MREAHAERHGKVYSWDNPPEGGHPGEDYNCRCYAEEYIPPYRKETNDNYLSEQERREALKQGKKIRLEVKDTPNANGSWPIYHSHTVGQKFVKYYSDKIEKYAEKYNVDLVKAIMYTENATGHWLGANYVKDFLGVSKSQAPMNIRGSLWNGIDGKIFDTRNADQRPQLPISNNCRY